MCIRDSSNGGHLTHGSPVNISGRSYNFIPYGLDPETETINFDNVRELALKHKPKLIVAAVSYTHLDVYKRQGLESDISEERIKAADSIIEKKQGAKTVQFPRGYTLTVAKGVVMVKYL